MSGDGDEHKWGLGLQASVDREWTPTLWKDTGFHLRWLLYESLHLFREDRYLLMLALLYYQQHRPWGGPQRPLWLE